MALGVVFEKARDDGICACEKNRSDCIEEHNEIHPYPKCDDVGGGEFAYKKQGNRDIKNIQK